MALRALDALEGVESTGVAAGYVEEAAAESEGDTAVALGAVRILGADVLAPYVLRHRALPDEESYVIDLALSALPPARPAPPPPPRGPEAPWLRAWADWGLVAALARVAPGHSSPHTAPLPEAPPACDDALPRRHPAVADPEDADSDGAAREGWVSWAVRMAALAPLALPGLDGPVHASARDGVTGLARGACRSMLRRDFPTAARLARWLAWLHHEGVPLPLDPVPFTQHLTLLGVGGRLALDTAIARELLREEPL
ncbi:hypothetical protein ABZ840_07180 [Streptomyces sp. NPDC047117]|uniref:hypothetical protein n=1 Tax=Streptomyces sp. NPDC047117 TaxID=3155379 RepID=UPI0033E7C020